MDDRSSEPDVTTWWQANARDAELHLTQQTAGNGIVTNQTFDPETGRLTAILAGSGNIVENFSYTYDVLGNVLTHTYDTLNRVTSATMGQSVAPVKTFAYNAIGNLLSKSDVGNYTIDSMKVVTRWGFILLSRIPI